MYHSVRRSNLFSLGPDLDLTKDFGDLFNGLIASSDLSRGIACSLPKNREVDFDLV